jgi:hypothetical protein
MVEGNYWYNGMSLVIDGSISTDRKHVLTALIFFLLSGLAFGLSVSTRYPTGLLIIAFLAYISGFYLLRAWPALKKMDLRGIFRDGMPAIFMTLAFAMGLFVILVPLMSYNAEYFGGPSNSGYDATPLMDFNRTGTLDVRNTTATWTGNVASYISTAAGNFARLLPTFLDRMPALLFLPIGIYCLRQMNRPNI